MTTTAREGGEGWGPTWARTWHYITKDGRSLCRKVGFAFDLPLEADTGKPGSRDCKACVKALAALRAEGGK